MDAAFFFNGQCITGGGFSLFPQHPCLDEYSDRLGVTEVPHSARRRYRRNFCQYTFIPTANGPIEIFGSDQLNSLQLYRARSILEFYLQDYDCADTAVDECFGTDKTAVRNQMGANEAQLTMPNGAHEEWGAGRALQGQPLHWSETPVEGDDWFMNNEYEDHRDAAFEEILHLVHDTGIGVDGSNSEPGVLPDYQTKIRAATNLNMPTNRGGNGIWCEGEDDYIRELEEDNNLSQEYFAAVVDTYYGLWGAWPEGGIWGIYVPGTREEVETLDATGAKLVHQFLPPYLTWMVALSPSLDDVFRMTFDENLPYTWKSQYYLHATLMGSNNAGIAGNDQDNCMAPNAGTNALDGLAGTDVVLFRGTCEDYTIACNGGGTCTVTDSESNRDGVTTTVNVEYLAFANGDWNSNTEACETPSAESEACREIAI